MEFDYLVVDGATCDRCGDSRTGVRAAVADARAMLPAAIEIRLVERELDAENLADSNRVLVNGLPAEEWLGGTSGVSDCPSCSDLIGADACCREVEVGGSQPPRSLASWSSTRSWPPPAWRLPGSRE